MEVEDFLLDLAWKDIENVSKAIENIETKAQIMIVATGILFPILVTKIIITSLWTPQVIIFIFPIASFICAFFATTNNVGSVDIKLDHITNLAKEGYSSQIKMILVEKIKKISQDAKNEGKKKLNWYLWSIYLFIASIASITGYSIGFLS